MGRGHQGKKLGNHLPTVSTSSSTATGPWSACGCLKGLKTTADPWAYDQGGKCLDK